MRRYAPCDFGSRWYYAANSTGLVRFFDQTWFAALLRLRVTHDDAQQRSWGRLELLFRFPRWPWVATFRFDAAGNAIS